MKQYFSQWAVKLLVGLIRAYQWISTGWPHRCRFYPSCSRYMIEALTRYGVFGGGGLGLKRLAKCHPWGPWTPETAIDPVP